MAALNLITEVLRSAASPQGAKWRHIDIGCGDGALIYYLSRNPAFSHVTFTGVDKDSRSMAWAKMFNPFATFYDAEMSSLEGGYDSVSLIEVLEHVRPAELPAFVSAAARLLRPGGMLVVTVPSVEKPVAEKHYQHFRFEDMKQLLQPDFTEIAICGFERTNLLARIIQRCRNNRLCKIDSPFLNGWLVRTFQRTHSVQQGCGRLLVTALRNQHDKY